MSDIDLKNIDAYPHIITDTVRYSDLDPNNHVNNGALLAYIEDGRTRMRSERFTTLGEDVLAGFVIARITVDYHAPMGFPNTVHVGTGVTRLGTKSYTLGQAVFLDKQCILSGEVVTVFVDRASGKSAPLSQDVRAILETLMMRG